MDAVRSLAVWGGGARAGLLAREKPYEYVFAYAPGAPAESRVSLTMPVRLESWLSRDLHPIFQMNLPEGALLEAIRRAIAKVVGEDDLAILRVTGGNQVGRNRFALPEEGVPRIVETPESLEDLLTYPDARELFRELVERYALRSGVSGVQPKVLLEAASRGTLAAAGYIVKAEGADFPHLAANEFLCMTAARRAGLPVPELFLSESGGLFVMRRFDLDPDGAPLGFEDLCSLQALGTAQKYTGSYERVARTLGDFVSGEHLPAARAQFFATLVLSVLVRNGDAHLKNFGVLYPFPGAPVRLAPVYDVVTTAAYLRNDVPALTLEGSKKWWPRRVLERFARAHLFLPVGTIREIFARTAEAVADTRGLVRERIAQHPGFHEVGVAMLSAWEAGLADLAR
ncbi:MAG: type II toxin-antitoxin system HipA family toxin [Thermodesulfobacteriota bacterium]